MVWFYERQGTFIRCETRESPNHVGFELLMIDPDGTEKIEHFADSQALEIRQRELQSTLVHDGWQGPFGRTI
jgi:hypothetical protein